MLLLAYDGKVISDEEFLVLWESCRSKNPDFPHSSYARFDLENIDKTECLAEFSPAGEPMCVFGDPAYPLRVHLQAPFRHGILTPMMEEYNAEMSSVRVTVEWLFGNIINDFKFLDFKKNLKIGMSSVGKMYLVCALLHNAITCLYGNSTSEFFGLNPPSLQDYVR